MTDCINVGTPDCPSYRLFVLKSHANEEVGPITQMCEAFEPIHMHNTPYDDSDYMTPNVTRNRAIDDEVEKTLDQLREMYGQQTEPWGLM